MVCLILLPISNFQGNRESEKVNMTKYMVNKTLICYLVNKHYCLSESDRFSLAVVTVKDNNSHDPILYPFILCYFTMSSNYVFCFHCSN